MQASGTERRPRSGGFPDMLTAKDLEALLKIDVKTIYSYVQRGLIPYVRIQSSIRFRREEVLDWIEQQSYWPHSRNGRTNGARPS